MTTRENNTVGYAMLYKKVQALGSAPRLRVADNSSTSVCANKGRFKYLQIYTLGQSVVSLFQ